MTEPVNPSQPEQSPGTALAPAGQPTALDLLYADSSGGPAYATNLATTGQAALKLMSRALAPPDKTADDLIGQVIEIEGYVAHRVNLSGDTDGEIIPGVRVVLVSPKGETYAFVSEGMESSLQMLVQFMGPGPWKPAVRAKVKRFTTRKGRGVLRLVIE